MYLRILTYCYKVYFIGLLACSGTNAIAQAVSETVNFDNYTSPTDNDLIKKFSSTSGFTQVTTSGITGGALTTPSFIEWGQDMAIYYSKYKGVTGGTTITGISFKYNGALVNPNADQRTVSIWLIPRKNPDHRLVATIERNKTLGLLGYQYTSAYDVSLSMLDDHWYKLQLSSTTSGGPFGDRIDYEVTVFELGLDGLASPVSIGSVTGTIYDIKFTTDNAIDVAFTGTKWGGAEFIDNFLFNGTKNTVPHIQIMTPVKNSIFWIPPLDSVEIVTTPVDPLDTDGENLSKTIQIYKDGSLVYHKTVTNGKAVFSSFHPHSSFKIYATLSDGLNVETRDSAIVTTENTFPDCKLTIPENGGALLTNPFFFITPIVTLSPPGIDDNKMDQDYDQLLYSLKLYTAQDSLLKEFLYWKPGQEINWFGFDSYYIGRRNFHKPLTMKLSMTDSFDTCYSVSTFIPNFFQFNVTPTILNPAYNEVTSYDSNGLLPILTEPLDIVDLEGDSLIKIFQITGPLLDTLIVARNGEPVYLRSDELLPGSEYSINAQLSDGYDTVVFATDHIFTTPLVTGLEDRIDLLMSVSPNPFEKEIMIAALPELRIERIRLLNILGQTVFDQRVVESGHLYPVVPSGTYILEGYDASGRRKVMIRIVRR